MKRLTDYISEEIYAVENPVPGDHFDIEVDTDTIIETVVTEITEDGVIIDLDEAALDMLQHTGVLLEDSNMPVAVDSASPISGQSSQDRTPVDGHMSPIWGNNFMPYDRKKDPREWFTDVKKKLKESEENPRDLEEAEYQGRKVPLGKRMKGDVKKSKVYVLSLIHI